MVQDSNPEPVCTRQVLPPAPAPTSYLNDTGRILPLTEGSAKEREERTANDMHTLSSLYLAARSNPIGYGEKREAYGDSKDSQEFHSDRLLT